jgi:hypothetical protein
MHWAVMSQANTCTYCMGSKVKSLSYSSYFVNVLLNSRRFTNNIDVCGASFEQVDACPIKDLDNLFFRIFLIFSSAILSSAKRKDEERKNCETDFNFNLVENFAR